MSFDTGKLAVMVLGTRDQGLDIASNHVSPDALICLNI